MTIDTIPPRSAGTPTLGPNGAALNRALARVTDAPLRLDNHLTLLRDGRDTYDDWLAAIGRARRWVHLENYIFKADTIGHRFAEALVERAAAGVAVRVLVDWFGSSTTPASFWERLRRAGVDVRLVTPPNVRDPLAVINRDHRKVLAVDGTYGSAGGVCIADEWLQHDPDTGLPYRDTAVRVEGPAVADIEHAFAAVWDRAGTPLPRAERPDLRQAPAAGDEAVRVIIQEPGKLRILRVLELLTAGVERRLWIADAYFLASPRLTQALTAAAADGVDVRLLLPATNDLPIVGALSRTGYRPLLESGIRIWEYGGLMMHAKTTVADGWWGRVGSTNLNITGLLTNWEIDIVAEDQRFGAAMEAMFEEDLLHAREIRLGGHARRPAARPDRPITPAERRMQRRSPGSGSRAVAIATRVGVGAVQASGARLARQERVVGGAISAGLLGIGLLGARFPRLLAWPAAGISGATGIASLLRTIRPAAPKQRSARARRATARRHKRDRR